MQGPTPKGTGPYRLDGGAIPPQGQSLTHGSTQTPSPRPHKGPPVQGESRTVTDSMAFASLCLTIE